MQAFNVQFGDFLNKCTYHYHPNHDMEYFYKNFLHGT